MKRPALVEVWCPSRRCRLAKVHAGPDGPLIYVSEVRLQAHDFFSASGRKVRVPPEFARAEEMTKGPPVVFRAGTYPLDGDGDGEQPIITRCKHGTYYVDRAELAVDVAEARRTGRTQHSTMVRWTGNPRPPGDGML